MAFKGFSGNSGPVAPPKTRVSFGASRPRSPSDSSMIRTRSVSPQPRQLLESSSADEERQREMEAKARRLARFNTDLVVQEQKRGKEAVETDQAMDCEGSDALADAILGSCSDMCPELEREERERKGDLDKFERLNGDRNLTNKFLAVKKYNRTAEREASLIRPLPVLQMTVDHLLKLIDRPYDEDFLSVNNFLWDRMRAIRMDLRMQHIFNRDAITMHEQMIRFHIVAMHELCEYAKGEGFSEGFDSHLNIEQMNKTSVELFQMYDDHRKQGSPVSSEPEFRGYYALLKLDKHPGYKVEAAELSLDLANMTSEIRNTNEVLFAREVARASRSGNYIAFFRLAKKATYLQACLMHAHFAKLRTQALASLHSGLQKNQGIPVAQIVKWLGMEGEDIEGFLEYHGFSIKQYEDVYMVKEGPFLNSERDFPTKCSQLVHQKRSTKVIDDVVSSGDVPMMESTWHTVKALNGTVDKLSNRAKWSHAPLAASVVSPEEEMADYEEDEQHGNDGKVKEQQMQEQFDNYQIKEVPRKGEVNKLPASLVLPNLGVEHAVPRSGAEKHAISGSMPLQDQQPKKKFRNEFSFEQNVQDSKRRLTLLEGEHLGLAVEMEAASGSFIHSSNERPGIGKGANCVVSSEAKYQEEEEEARLNMYRAEAESAKLKLYLRRWKRQAMKNAHSRRLHQIKVDTALSSLFLGPPIRSSKEMTPKEEIVAGIPRVSAVELSIDQVLRERHSRHEKMWSRLDVPEMIAPILSERNPQAQCLCWKLVICSRTHDKVGDTTGMCKYTIPMVGRWLHAKLMGDAKTISEALLHSSSDLAIWKKWVSVPIEHGGTSDLCFLSILKDVAFNVDRAESEDAGQGASGLLFLLLEDVQWDLERARLQSLVRTIPSGSKLPLLILSSGNVGGRGSMFLQAAEYSDSSVLVTIEKQLELSNLDRTRISSWLVNIITENEHNDARGFFNDDCLREGLQWLARQAPLQPIIYPADVRDLVLEYLDAYLKILLNGKPTEVMPNHCVHVFNEALDRTASEIISAAQKSLPGWPAPEINLLDENMEGEVLKSYLPNSGWNKASNFESIVHALRLCRLPQFPSFSLNFTSCGVQQQEFSLLKFHSGRSMWDEVEEQKIALEKSLYQYLSQLSLIRKGGDLMALKEADLLVQKCTTFECNGLRHLIIPKWASIFRRIYNWRLMLLASEPALVAYVSRPRNIDLAVNEVKHLLSCARQIFMSSGYSYEMEPSLSDMVGVGSMGIPRGPRLAPSMQILKDHFLWHAWKLDPENVVENVITEMSQYSLGKRNGQHKIEPIQLPAMNNLMPVEGHVREVEYCIPDPDEVQHLIEFPQTQGEFQLDQAMTKFCEKVDEQNTWTALGTKEANVMNSSDIAKVADRTSVNENALFAKNGFVASGQMRRLQTSVSESLPSRGIDCRITGSTPAWATNDGMDKLTKLLDQCNTIQSSIDKKLALYFNEKNGLQFG